MSRPDLIVGIDFGMTCTGVAYANLTRGNNINCIKKWPYRSQANEDKVPTLLAYPKTPINPYSQSPTSWGFGSESQTERDDKDKDYVEWFKIYLDPRVLQEHQRKDPRNAPKSQAHIDKWYEDYLRLLYQHIEHKLGSELPANKPWRLAKVEFILSLPTTWQPYPTVEKFKSIINSAGYSRHPSHSFSLGLTEPEAAAVHTSMEAAGMFRENEVILVCDAGGGTTDLSILRITGAYSGFLSLKQLDVVTGKNIGSVAIDRKFEDYIAVKLQQATSMFRLRIDPIETAWHMVKSREYQNAKCDYGSPDMTPIFTVPIQGISPTFSNEQFRIANATMKFQADELKAIFDSQITRLFLEIDNQLQSFQKNFPGDQIAHLILSGGLGNSGYVQSELKNRYAFGMSRFPCAQRIEIHVAPDPQLAVCKGIVSDRVRKLQSGKAVLEWRCARASYGTLCKVLYDRNNPDHFSRPTFRDPLNGKLYINNAIVWFIKKGEPVSADDHIVHKFSRKLTPGDPSRAFPTSVVKCDLEKAFLPPQITKDAQILCEVKSDLSGADERKFKKKNRHWWSIRKPYYRVDYQIRTVIGAADLRFELWFDGQKLNKDNPIQIDWQAATAPQKLPDEGGIYMDKAGSRSFTIPRSGVVSY